jgi:protein-arginine kinase activator protein McsA
MEPCPFSGQLCHHKKCIHITDVENYTATKSLDMCILCGIPYLAKENSQEEKAMTIADLINLILGGKALSTEVVMPAPLPQPKITIPSCPSCGHSINDIALTGKIGCDNCYAFFKKELLPLIEKCQGATQHVGKCPKNESIENLEKALKEAVKQENYELALEIKSKINKLK